MIVAAQHKEAAWKLRFAAPQYGSAHLRTNVIGAHLFEGSQYSTIIERTGRKRLGGIPKQGVGHNHSWFRLLFGAPPEGPPGNIAAGVKAVGAGRYVFKICLAYRNTNDVSGYEL